MKYKLELLVIGLALTLPASVGAQGTFGNLNFESVIPPLNPDINFSVPISNALPRWNGYLNGNRVDRVDYNSFNLSGPSISLVNSLFFQPIQGSYSVYLKSFSDTGGTSAAIGQTGQIPNSALSLFFIREPQSGFAVSFEGQAISMVQFGTSGNNILMAGDISMFAGQTGELRFAGTGLFDSIQFSTQQIPEPSTVGLIGLGVLLLGSFRQKKMKTLMLMLKTGFAALLLTGLAPAFGQGTFRNLDFEQAIPLASNYFPEWTVYAGSVIYNNASLGGDAVSLHDTGSTGFQPLQGNYSVFLQGSAAGPPMSAAIGQIGQIPFSSLAIQFWADPRSNLQVTFGGTLIPTFRIASTANYDVFGGNISIYAGQTAELRFTGPANSGGYFDNIFFSNQQVPEPSTFGLIGLGALLFGYRARRVISS